MCDLILILFLQVVDEVSNFNNARIRGAILIQKRFISSMKFPLITQSTHML